MHPDLLCGKGAALRVRRFPALPWPLMFRTAINIELCRRSQQEAVVRMPHPATHNQERLQGDRKLVALFRLREDGISPSVLKTTLKKTLKNSEALKKTQLL